MRIFKTTLLVAILLATLLSACGAKPTSSAATTPADSNASADSRTVLAYLAALTLGAQPGVIVGQNVGHGSQILDTTGSFGYAPLVGALTRQTNETPGMIGVDYEHDQIFTPGQLSAANKILIAHWQKGGW